VHLSRINACNTFLLEILKYPNPKNGLMLPVYISLLESFQALYWFCVVSFFFFLGFSLDNHLIGDSGSFNIFIGPHPLGKTLGVVAAKFNSFLHAT